MEEVVFLSFFCSFLLILVDDAWIDLGCFLLFMIFYVIVMCCLNFSLNMYLDNFFVVMISLLNPKHLLIKTFEKKKKTKTDLNFSNLIFLKLKNWSVFSLIIDLIVLHLKTDL